MAIPDYQTLMRPLLVCLLDKKAHKLSSLVEALSDEFKLSPQERLDRIPSGSSTYIHGRVGWARTYLKQAGLVAAPQRGYLEITALGHKAITECPERIENSYLKQFESFQLFLKRSKSKQTDLDIEQNTATDDSLIDPLERLEQAHAEINASLVSDLLQLIREQTPIFFERLVVDLMLAMGYGGWSTQAGQATQYTADGGIDGIINEDPLGLETIYLQAKRYKEGNTIGRPAIQAFVGALEMKRARKGVFITASSFSREALEYVSLIDKKVILIDGQQLAEYMIHYKVAVSNKERYQINVIDSDYFNED